MMTAHVEAAAPADRVLPITRIVSAIIVPVLVAAFIMLYLLPNDTGRLFSWPVGPTMTAMMLGATYIGGAYFFTMVIISRQWHTVKLGLLPVSSFAGILGIATILHWDAFTHDHISFHLWALLYFTLPFILPAIWYFNRQAALGAEVDGPMLSRELSISFGALGVVLIGAAIMLLLFPERMAETWPWAMSALTGRVMAAKFALSGGVGLGIAIDRRWNSARIPLQAQTISVLLILLAMARARSEISWNEPGSWLMLAGMILVLVLVAAAYLQSRGRA